jgi:hypothetical protein
MPECPTACSGDEWQELAFFVKNLKGFHPSNSPKKESKNLGTRGEAPLGKENRLFL